MSVEQLIDEKTYKNKYLKYKQKYNIFKNQIGSGKLIQEYQHFKFVSKVEKMNYRLYLTGNEVGKSFCREFCLLIHDKTISKFKYFKTIINEFHIYNEDGIVIYYLLFLHDGSLFLFEGDRLLTSQTLSKDLDISNFKIVPDLIGVSLNIDYMIQKIPLYVVIKSTIVTETRSIYTYILYKTKKYAPPKLPVILPEPKKPSGMSMFGSKKVPEKKSEPLVDTNFICRISYIHIINDIILCIAEGSYADSQGFLKPKLVIYILYKDKLLNENGNLFNNEI